MRQPLAQANADSSPTQADFCNRAPLRSSPPLTTATSRPYCSLCADLLGFAPLLGARPSPQRERVVAMVAARLLEPHSKLATTRWWHNTTLPPTLGVSDADEDDLYDALDWLLKRQDRIERKLAARHLDNDAHGVV